MAWLIQNRTGKWFVGGPDPRRMVEWTLTRHEDDACRFPTREAAEAMRTEYLSTFQDAYQLIEADDDGDDATPA